MNENMLLAIMQDSFMTLVLIAGPILLTALVIGLIVSILQATTQIQEQTLTFVPKLIAILLIFVVMGPYFISVLTGYFNRMVDYILIIT